MVFFGGLSSRAAQCCQLPDQTCPHCGAGRTFTITKSYDYLHAFFLPLWKFHQCFFATCNHCGQSWALRPETGKQLAQGAFCTLTPQDLAPAGQICPTPSHCPQCGVSLARGSRFCQNCGHKLDKPVDSTR